MRAVASHLFTLIAIGIALCAALYAKAMRDEQESYAVAIINLDRDGYISEWSSGATKLFGWTRGEVIGKRLDFLMTPECWEKHAAGMGRLDEDPPQHERLITIDSWCYNNHGELIPVYIVAAGYIKNDGYYHHIAIIAKRDAQAPAAATSQP
jgi:PAS domain S-box-containing protein